MVSGIVVCKAIINTTIHKGELECQNFGFLSGFLDACVPQLAAAPSFIVWIIILVVWRYVVKTFSNTTKYLKSELEVCFSHCYRDKFVSKLGKVDPEKKRKASTVLISVLLLRRNFSLFVTLLFPSQWIPCGAQGTQGLDLPILFYQTLYAFWVIIR